MNITEIQKEIRRLKEEKGFCILAHAYQGEEILEIADYVGDSFGLSEKAQKDDRKNVIMCGVRFMAETCKVLSPEKHVYLANAAAGCPMADQITRDELKELKKKYPDYTVVTYVNTNSDLKTLSDVCVTSSSAVKICKNIENDKILFLPDPNLGSYVSEKVPEKTFVFAGKGCPRHASMCRDYVLKAKKAHPDAEFLVHPECRKEVVELADYVGSTTGIMAYAGKSDKKEFIIGTENSIVEHLQFAYPDKKFYPLSVNLTCVDMKITSLMDVYHILLGEGGEEIELPDDVMEGASKSINQMIELG